MYPVQTHADRNLTFPPKNIIKTEAETKATPVNRVGCEHSIFKFETCSESVGPV